MIPALIGAGAAIGGAVYNNYKQSEANKQAQKDWKKQQNYLYNLAQQSQVNAASNNVKGLKLAGLNPALAAGGNFSPVATPVASTPNYKTPETDFSGIADSFFQAANQKMQERQLANAERQVQIQDERSKSAMKVDDANVVAALANADKAQAEADDIRRNINRSNAEDRIASVRVQTFLQSKYDDAVERGNDYEANIYKRILDSGDFNSGSLRGMSNWNEYTNQESRISLEISQRQFDATVLELKKSNDAAKALAEMPVNQQQKILNEINQIAASVDLTKEQKDYVTAQASLAREQENESRSRQNLQDEQRKNVAKDTDLKAKQIDLTDEQIKEVRKKIDLLTQQIASLYHKDYNSMVEKGDYVKSWTYLLENILNISMRGLIK